MRVYVRAVAIILVGLVFVAAAATTSEGTVRAQIDRAFELSQKLLGLKHAGGDVQGTRTGLRYDAALPVLPDQQIISPDIRTAQNVGVTGGPAGIRITGEEIAGYSGDDDMQFRLRASDGKAEAAGGLVVLDAAGISIKGDTSLVFRKADDGIGGIIYASESSGSLIILGSIGIPRIRAQHLDPVVDNSEDLGNDSDPRRWRTLHTNSVKFADGTELDSAKRTITMTASENLTAGDVVWITGAGTVGKTTSGIGAGEKVVGVVMATATSGNPVRVQTSGRATVTANATITAGDRVTISIVTAGRVALYNTESHAAENTHTHTNPNTGTPSATGTVGSASHGHTVTSSGSAGGDARSVATGGHTHTQGNTGSEDGTGSHAHTNPNVGLPSSDITVQGEGHTHSSGATGGPSTTTEIATSTHTHTQAVTGVGDSHTHTAHTTGILLGKALTSAASAGNTLDILITLGG
jgi:hypothetical protein